MFVLFLIYPVVSIATMRTFNCDSNLGLLKDDYRMTCPPVFSFLFLYSFVFFLLFPVGIPLFMNSAMKGMNMKKIVERKMNDAKFSAMLACFMKLACSVESQRVARLVGNVDNDEEEFLRQTEMEFEKLLEIQGDEETVVLNVQQLRTKVDADHGMQGVNIEDLCLFFEQFDENGDGDVDLDEFRIMVRTCRSAANLFTGNEVHIQLPQPPPYYVLMYHAHLSMGL